MGSAKRVLFNEYADSVNILGMMGTVQDGKGEPMIDEFTLTLNSPITEEQWDMITDVDFDNTNEITFHTKHGKEVKFVKASAQPDGIPLEWINKHLEWLDNCDNDFAQLAKVSIRAMVETWKKDKT